MRINLKKIWLNKKTDEIWSEQKSEENLMKFEVNINLKKIWWNKKKTVETWCKHKPVEKQM